MSKAATRIRTSGSSDQKDTDATTRNVVIPTLEENYQIARQFAQSGFDPQVARRMQQEALDFLYRHRRVSKK